MVCGVEWAVGGGLWGGCRVGWAVRRDGLWCGVGCGGWAGGWAVRWDGLLGYGRTKARMRD